MNGQHQKQQRRMISHHRQTHSLVLSFSPARTATVPKVLVTQKRAHGANGRAIGASEPTGSEATAPGSHSPASPGSVPAGARVRGRSLLVVVAAAAAVVFSSSVFTSTALSSSSSSSARGGLAKTSDGEEGEREGLSLVLSFTYKFVRRTCAMHQSTAC